MSPDRKGDWESHVHLPGLPRQCHRVLTFRSPLLHFVWCPWRGLILKCGFCCWCKIYADDINAFVHNETRYQGETVQAFLHGRSLSCCRCVRCRTGVRGKGIKAASIFCRRIFLELDRFVVSTIIAKRDWELIAAHYCQWQVDRKERGGKARFLIHAAKADGLNFEGSLQTLTESWQWIVVGSETVSDHQGYSRSQGWYLNWRNELVQNLTLCRQFIFLVKFWRRIVARHCHSVFLEIFVQSIKCSNSHGVRFHVFFLCPIFISQIFLALA